MNLTVATETKLGRKLYPIAISMLVVIYDFLYQGTHTNRQTPDPG